MVNYNEVASKLRKELEPGSYKNILFVAEQLRFSDDQVKLIPVQTYIHNLVFLLIKLC